MNEFLAILDTDMVYAQRLCQKLNSEEGFPFSTVCFSQKEELLGFAAEQKVVLLLIAREMEDLDIRSLQVRQTMYLTDVRGYSSVDARPMLFKYQPVYRMKEEILKCYAESEAGDSKTEETISRCAFFGVMSPAGGGLEHRFSVVLGQLLSQDAKVLYVDLEPFSAYRELFDWEYEGDLAELVYERSVRRNLPDLDPYLLDFHGLQLLAPIRLAEDCSEMEPKEIFETIREIGYRLAMDVVIMNFGSEVRIGAGMLPYCQRLFVPTGAGVGKERLAAFYGFVERQKDGEKRVVQEVQLPGLRTFKSGKASMEQLLWSELGEAVRKQLGEVAEWM